MSVGITYAKCCYCGQKTIVDRGVLKCNACAAPLTKFGAIPRANAPRPKVTLAKFPAKPPTQAVTTNKRKKSKPKRVKRNYAVRQFFEFIEDAVDEVADIFD